jgi:photosystem II stability/assembly factor-like uncharacterized protein
MNMLRFFIFPFVLILFFPLKAQVSGAAYTCLGPFELPGQNMGFINQFYADKSEPSVIYAGSLYGGLWKGTKTDSVWRWKNITDTWKIPGTGISGICVVPNSNSQVIYIGTQMGGNARQYGYSNGILKTDDGGKSWKQVGPQVKVTDMKEVDILRMCPDDPAVIFARIGKDLFYTEDGWNTYRQLNNPFKNTDKNMHLSDVEWKPGDKKSFYITSKCDGGIRAEFYKTSDAGNTWTDMLHGTSAGNIQLDVVNKPGMKEMIWMMYGNNGGILQIYDGKSWSKNKNSAPVFNGSGYWNMQFDVNDDDTSIMYFSMTTVAKSTNGGRSFFNISDYWGAATHADVREMKLLKGTKGGEGDVLAMANDGVEFQLLKSERRARTVGRM